MRLGFVGVGKWAQKLMAAFEAEGAVLFAYDRASKPEYPNLALPFGSYMPWQDMLIRPDVDALVLCAPPGPTTDVALACAAAGKPVMATKPLMLEQPVPIGAPFYVDFFRLWSEVLERFANARTVNRIDVLMTGAGPFRSFPGLLDYGPHAMAYVRWLLGDEVKVTAAAYDGRATQGELVVVGGEGFTVQAGNGDTRGFRSVSAPSPVKDYRLVLDETPEHMVFGDFKEEKFLVLRRMCRAFMNDVAEGFVTTEHLDLSCAVMRDLAEARRLADQGAK